jgi:putative hydrolase of the HAD superfamily
MAAVCFDAAGTLIRVRGSVGGQYAAVARRLGVDADPAALDAAFPAAFRSAPPMAFPGAAADAVPALERAWWRALVQRLVEAVGLAPALDVVGFDRYFDQLYDHFTTPAAWEVYPDVRPTLAAVRARGCRIGLVTNFDGRIVPLLDALGLTSSFDALTLSSRVGAAKPDARIFGAALTALGVPPAAALHVGDSPEDDVAGARAAGLGAVLVDRDGRHPDVPGRVRSLAEVTALL